MRSTRCWLLPLLLTGWMGSAAAQAPESEPDFELVDESPMRWQPFGELLLRGDRVTGLPGGREDLQRLRARVRAGALRQHETLSFGVALEAALGTDANRRNLINNDVEKSDALGVDQAWMRWQASDRLTLQLGKAPLPLALAPMLWDEALRPIGASVGWSGSRGDFDRWQVDLGAFAPDPLGERGARLTAMQVAWHLREGAPLSGGVLLGLLDFGSIDDLARAGLGRGNSLQSGRYREDYRLLDAQAYLRGRAGGKPLEFRIDRVRNLDARRERDATRASLVYGDRLAQPGWELGWAWQRIQRDAVLAAVNEDDWWFHTATRGHMPWIGYGFGDVWSLRLAAFFETRDDLDERTERLLLDLEARW